MPIATPPISIGAALSSLAMASPTFGYPGKATQRRTNIKLDFIRCLVIISKPIVWILWNVVLPNFEVKVRLGSRREVPSPPDLSNLLPSSNILAILYHR